MRLDRLHFLVFVLLFIAGGVATRPQTSQTSDPESARALVRSVIETETARLSNGQRYIYRQERPQKKSLLTYQLVQTDQVRLEKLIAVNGQALSPEQEASEKARLDKLDKDLRLQTKLRNDQEAESKRRLLMLRTLPDAFLFSFDAAGSEEPLVKIDFRPDPKFRPSAKEVQPYRGMEGSLWIDRQKGRLARVHGKLTKDVSFRWGILGHLHRGGTFTIEQQNVYADDWAVTKMELHFTGSALLFKSSRIEYSERSFQFRPTAAGMSINQGIALLERVNLNTNSSE